MNQEIKCGKSKLHTVRAGREGMAVMKKINRNLVDDKTGLISRRIFFDSEIYAQELKDVFARTWLFLGHESMIPESGDYVTNYMGEDPVIVWRDKNRKI